MKKKAAPKKPRPIPVISVAQVECESGMIEVRVIQTLGEKHQLKMRRYIERGGKMQILMNSPDNSDCISITIPMGNLK